MAKKWSSSYQTAFAHIPETTLAKPRITSCRFSTKLHDSSINSQYSSISKFNTIRHTIKTRKTVTHLQNNNEHRNRHTSIQNNQSIIQPHPDFITVKTNKQNELNKKLEIQLEIHDNNFVLNTTSTHKSCSRPTFGSQLHKIETNFHFLFTIRFRIILLLCCCVFFVNIVRHEIF